MMVSKEQQKADHDQKKGGQQGRSKRMMQMVNEKAASQNACGK
jgi:hypothetical protein